MVAQAESVFFSFPEDDSWVPEVIENYSSPRILLHTMQLRPEHAPRCRSHAATLLDAPNRTRHDPDVSFLLRLCHHSDAQRLVQRYKMSALGRVDLGSEAYVVALRLLASASGASRVNTCSHAMKRLSVKEICAVKKAGIVSVLHDLPWDCIKDAVHEDAGALRVHIMPWFDSGPMVSECLMDHHNRPTAPDLNFPGLVML